MPGIGICGPNLGIGIGPPGRSILGIPGGGPIQEIRPITLSIRVLRVKLPLKYLVEALCLFWAVEVEESSDAEAVVEVDT